MFGAWTPWEGFHGLYLVHGHHGRGSMVYIWCMDTVGGFQRGTREGLEVTKGALRGGGVGP